MTVNWKYDDGSSVGNNWVNCCPENWSKGEGRYQNGHDFFSVHWEVRLKRPDQEYDGTVRLHVESPYYSKDATLNDIKRDVIAALHASNVGTVARQSGFEFTLGTKTSLAQIQQHKCTEAFRVRLSEDQRKTDHMEEMKTVHAALGPVVDQILRKFEERLSERFR